jgi:hypothetical protein
MNLIVILLIGAIIFYLFKWWESKKKQTLVKTCQKSIGIMDNEAKKAVEIYNDLYMPDNQDILNYNRIVELNENEGRVENKQEFNRIVEQYTNVLDDELDWFEIHQIENFADRHQDMLNHREHNVFLDNIIQAPKKNIIKNVEEIKNTTENKSQAVEEYTKLSKTQTSDSQNVHDSSVNVQLKDGFNELKNTSNSSFNKTQIEQEIQENINKLDPGKKNRAQKSFQTILKNKTPISSLNDTEDSLLYLVWKRSNEPVNKENSDLIKESVVNALIDISTTGNSVVCAGGRCTRIFDSLVLLDDNQKLARGLATTEQIKNDMLEKSNSILQEKIKEYSVELPDADHHRKELEKVAKSYIDPSITVSELVEKDFKNLVVKDISESIEKEYKDKLSTRDYTNIKNQCIEGVLSI